jgi:predicted dehydrogenase
MMLSTGPPHCWLTLEGAMKVGLLGTGFGMAHAHIYHAHPQVSEVVVFGRTPAKLQAFAEKFGYAITTDLSGIYDDPAIDLVDVCLPTPLHAEHVTRALAAGKHVLCELPLAATMDDARHIVDAAAASDRQVFVDMFGRFDPATEVLHAAIAEGRYGTLRPWPWSCAARCCGRATRSAWTPSPWTSCTAAWTRSCPPWVDPSR